MKDILGATCSGLCMTHCLGLPVLAATGTSFVGLAYLSGESTHRWLSAAMVCIALWAFPAGWRTHKQFLPGLLAIMGVMLIALTIIAPVAVEAYWAVASGVTLISAHLLNRRLLIERHIQ